MVSPSSTIINKAHFSQEKHKNNQSVCLCVTSPPFIFFLLEYPWLGYEDEWWIASQDIWKSNLYASRWWTSWHKLSPVWQYYINHLGRPIGEDLCWGILDWVLVTEISQRNVSSDGWRCLFTEPFPVWLDMDLAAIGPQTFGARESFFVK